MTGEPQINVAADKGGNVTFVSLSLINDERMRDETRRQKNITTKERNIKLR